MSRWETYSAPGRCIERLGETILLQRPTLHVGCALKDTLVGELGILIWLTPNRQILQMPDMAMFEWPWVE
jgi:hypothetical protein